MSIHYCSEIVEPRLITWRRMGSAGAEGLSLFQPERTVVAGKLKL
jgi:hypothetical protein